MIDMKVKIEDRTNRVNAAVERAIAGNVRAGAFVVSQDAKQSIAKAPKAERVPGGRRGKRGRRQVRRPSPAGSPPYTLKGELPRAIQYAATKDTAIIGPAFSRVGTGGEPHEQGGEYRGGDYPERPFMRPSLENNLGRFAGSFEGSVN